MAKHVYTDGKLHSNGEVYSVTTPEGAKALVATFPSKGSFTDNGKDIYISVHGNAYLEMTIDTTDVPFGEKPQCNNAFDCDCDCSCSDNGSDSSSESESNSDVTSDSDSDSVSDSEA